MYTRENDKIVGNFQLNDIKTERTLYTNKNSYIIIAITFSISIGIIISLVLYSNRIFFGIISAIITLFIFLLLWCFKI